jgi:hypothetical protein
MILSNKYGEDQMQKKNYKFIEHISPKGYVYNMPEHLTGLSISAQLRQMSADGYSKWAIHKATGIRYQMVANILDSTPRLATDS